MSPAARHHQEFPDSTARVLYIGQMPNHLVHVHVHALSSHCILLDCTPDLDLLLKATQAAFHCKRMHRFQSGVVHVEEKMAGWHKSEASSAHKTSDGSLLTGVDPVIVAPRLPPLWRDYFAHPDVPDLGMGVQILATLLQKSKMSADNVQEEKNDEKHQTQRLATRTVSTHQLVEFTCILVEVCEFLLCGPKHGSFHRFCE
jgi:hypothetical protein